MKMDYTIDFIDSADERVYQGERLRLEYIRLEDAVFWDHNPKLHAMSDIVDSIRKNGFVDPGKWDQNLNGGQGGFVFGNGRTEALLWMFQQNQAAPKGVLIHQEQGYWCIPCIFGLDADSEQAAERFGVDHNALGLMGGDFNHIDLSKLYDFEAYIELLENFADEGEMPISVSIEDLEALQHLHDVEDDSDEEEEGSSGTAGDDDGSTETVEHDSESWPRIDAQIRPDLYEVYLTITENYAGDDATRLEGLLSVYQRAQQTQKQGKPA